ncbi:hypothetical protein JQK15_08600 [Sphingobium sp. BHU LFT2]|uniref:hypothetical protein n=1 Tax=Sphingobium sp. BHU LFT2 TaxID=2807634 RepID=UPI001BEBC452|nr:hypothetical protein [Sphingobium sp. BHU LFT2]MBT2243598.1 hypothetical protein [Sphingobium sp. BHU LFT2]
MVKARKPKISEEEALVLARNYIAQQDLAGWRLEVAEAQRPSYDPSNWAVVVDRFSPEGGLVDGPEILIVNGVTGEVKTFGDHY